MRSIKMKWMLAIVILLTILIGAMILVNSIFLEKYYIFKNKSTFVEEYEELLEEHRGISDDKFLDILRSHNSITGYKYLVVNEKYDTVLSSSPEFKKGDRLRLPKEFKEFIEINQKKLEEGHIFYDALKNNENENYHITLAAKLRKDHFLLITKPLQQVRENVAIANDFFIMIGIGVLIIGVVLSNFMSRRIVRPILEITDITSKIAHLDFSERYHGALKDEVGILGKSINTISEKLHSTISDLKQANDDLQGEIQLQKRFLASVSHEFKTPVGLIRGYTESLHLGMAKDTEEAKEFTSIILQETDRLNRLISDIIFLMHVDSGVFQMTMRDFDLSKSIKEVASKFSQMPSDKPFELQIDIPPSLQVLGDEGRLIQVLENLISNGIRHVNSGGILKISAEQKNNVVKVAVYNSGEEIPEEHLSHLFNAFYSAQDSRSRNKGGTGLGLSVVNSIIQKHKGQCGVFNKENGVVFWFTLPTQN
ncbi:HAMP domain-containing sensor histidine kinase [Wukongibacter baidiensis]|uniref:sensor histidine kinase n=1 Tax=Wukongibacter baidiensis TaxID=1723361 RepID=UPI003D7F609F